MTIRRVAVIGAGVSGLTATKCCLAEGLDVVCYEKTEDIGGLWNFRENAPENQSTVMKSTVVNTSKELMAFSDYPPPAELPNFMHNSHVYQYLSQYASHFKLYEKIRFSTEVLSVRHAPSYAETGRWIVQTSQDTQEFDGVVVCSGHHSAPHVPNIPGLEKFEGSIWHSQRYRDWKGFEDKKVLLIGFGNSALDTAVELCRVAKKTLISTRRGGWVFRRVCYWGYPFDMMFLSRWLEHLKRIMPNMVADTFFEAHADLFLDHDMYGLRPPHRFFSQHATINDQLPNCLATGAIALKPNTSDFLPKAVVFEDGSQEEIDTIILCTGYDITFPFLEKDVANIEDNKVDLYGHIFPTDQQHPTLAFVGLVQPMGALAPISELQSRWIAQIFSKQKTLPTSEEMRVDVQRVKDMMHKRYAESRRHTIQVDYVTYMQEMAIKVGCEPNFLRMLFTDPALFFEAYFGPSTPYMYRLEGPGSIPEARDAILTSRERVRRPLEVQRRSTGDLRPRGFFERIVGHIWVLLFLFLWPMLMGMAHALSYTAKQAASQARKKLALTQQYETGQKSNLLEYRAAKKEC